MEIWSRIPDLYRAMKDYGSSYITAPLSEKWTVSPPIDDHERDLIRQVYERYGDQNGVQLSQLTHQDGTPWHATWEPDLMGRASRNDLIAEHYRRLADGKLPKMTSKKLLRHIDCRAAAVRAARLAAVVGPPEPDEDPLGFLVAHTRDGRQRERPGG